jgi:hypothetical protein
MLEYDQLLEKFLESSSSDVSISFEIWRMWIVVPTMGFISPPVMNNVSVAKVTR